jgi:hypothetical protein
MQEFPFAFDLRYARFLQLLGISPASARVIVTDHTLDARFGWWRVVTPLTNISGTAITGPYQPLKVIGPRLSLADRGLSFGTGTDRGLCVLFHRPIPGIEPFGVIRHPGLTMTVTDPERLAGVLAIQGWPSGG